MRRRFCSMKKLLFAVIVLAFSACTKEISITVEPRQPIHVTVGAGIGDANPQTRSQVTKDGTTRTLKFTEGDRLYIVGNIDDTHRMGGYLDLTSGEGTTSATFAGNLTVWKKPGNFNYTEDNNYTLQHPDNPMLEYGENSVEATLIHKDAISGSIVIDDNTHLCSFDYSKCLVTGNDDNASELMKSGILVRGTYDATTGKFPLRCGDPIFNCTFNLATNGPAPSAPFYSVRIVKDDDNTTYTQTVNADANRNVHFAITTDLSGEGNWKIQVKAGPFSQSSGTLYERPIGNKNLGAKVYNVSYPKTAFLLSEVTFDHIGWIVGGDGNVYQPVTTTATSPLPSSTLPNGVSMAAMVCYVSSTGHGLAIELNSNLSQQFYGTAVFNKVMSVAAGKTAVSGGTWRLPSLADWDNMVNGCGGAEGFITKYGATGFNLFPTGSQVQLWASDYSQNGSNDYDVNFVKFKVTYNQYDYSHEEESMLGPELGLDDRYYLSCFAF